MLDTLREFKLLTVTPVNALDTTVENAHRAEFIRFLREIPECFRSIARHPKKREVVRNHLRKFYKNDPSSEDVDIVLERVTNLAALVELGRNAVENKTAQHRFKNDNWSANNRCALCGFEFQTFDQVTLDHILPLSLGGAEKPQNWQLTCKLCNNQKQEFWGTADLSRAVSIRISQGSGGTFFSMAIAPLLDNLKLKGNPTRYWVLEKNNRKCIRCDCSASETQLFVGVLESDFLPTVDNLAAFCVDCLNEDKIPYCNYP